MQHTQGNWKLGKHVDTVISDTPMDDEDLNKYYGGRVVAESISTDADRHLISAAPELLIAAQKAYETLGAILDFYGIDLQIANWHLNGELESFDNFIEENTDGDELELLSTALKKAKVFKERTTESPK